MDDSTTELFTRIPRSISKKWKTIQENLNSAAHHSRCDSTSSLPVFSIELTVSFSDDYTTGLDAINEETDNSTDRINKWQRGRKAWAAINEALKEIVSELNNESLTNASEANLCKYSVLSSAETTYIVEKAYVPPTPRAMNRRDADIQSVSTRSTHLGSQSTIKKNRKLSRSILNMIVT
jgi:hypothetical protein